MTLSTELSTCPTDSRTTWGLSRGPICSERGVVTVQHGIHPPVVMALEL